MINMQDSTMNSTGVTVSDSPTPANLFDEFEEAFQSCLAPLTKEDPLNGINQEELKVNAETNSRRFLELAHRMEAFFLQKRFLLSVQKPEAFISEENLEMRAELQRKEELIKKQTEKLSECQNTLMSLISRVGTMPGHGPRPGTAAGMSIPIVQTNQNTTSITATAPVTQSSAGIQKINSPVQSMSMNHGTASINSSTLCTNQQSMMSQVRVGSNVSVSQNMNQGNFSPMATTTHHGSITVNNQSSMGIGSMSPMTGHPSNVSTSGSVGATSGIYPEMGNLTPTQGGLQGPLAFLEKTTTNIGMPESRR